MNRMNRGNVCDNVLHMNHVNDCNDGSCEECGGDRQYFGCLSYRWCYDGSLGAAGVDKDQHFLCLSLLGNLQLQIASLGLPFNIIMEEKNVSSTLEIDLGVSIESSDSEFGIGDFEEDTQLLYFSNVIPKLQFRKDVSVARWDCRQGMAEVIVKKGRMWTTTGVVRQGKLFCLIEEVIFMVEQGALLLLEGDKCLSVEDAYNLLAEESYGCTWEFYQVYCHLKSLGYIVGRHNFPWTLKCKETEPVPCNLEFSEGLNRDHENGAVNRNLSDEAINDFQSNSTTGLREEENVTLASALENISITGWARDPEQHKQGLKLVFDVYLPNTKFKKSVPGLPDFILCIARDCPPKKTEVQALQLQCGEIPLICASSECGHISFFSFHTVKLPVLP